MAINPVCNFFKYGHCCFIEICRYEHVKEICENTKCMVQDCRKRHPRVCIYFKELGRCKFNSFCNFKHELLSESKSSGSPQQDQIAALTASVTKLEKSIEMLVMEMNCLKEKLTKIESNVLLRSVGDTHTISETSRSEFSQFKTPDRTASYPANDEEGNMVDDVSARKVVIGPGLASYPAWSFKTP